MHMVGYRQPRGIAWRCSDSLSLRDFCGWKAEGAGWLYRREARPPLGCGYPARGRRETAHKAVHLKIDASKAQVRLGWHPRLATDVALDWTAAWYRRQQDGASARDLCLDQIQRNQKQGGR